ncbi:uncharacterized protein ARMOST_12439 [Armillaria ostoyae]|uniref:HMG box domain-containing protein n=1 Tax=Armillaria ostoyae TaxID=47428 RepID=A0A284RJX0_ARMOS|nr:uncharacterized protein ARMOST_12439 [Armillaria ostoyae]
MSACNHAVFSARSTIGSLFASKETIGLGIIFPFNFSSQEEARIAIVASPSMSHSRAKFWLDSSSPIFHPSISTSYSTHLSQTTKSELTIQSLTKVLTWIVRIPKQQFLIKLSLFRNAAVPQTPMLSLRHPEKNLPPPALPVPFSSDTVDCALAPLLREVETVLTMIQAHPLVGTRTTPYWTRLPLLLLLNEFLPWYPSQNDTRKQPAGLGLGLPPSISLRTASPLVSSPPISLDPLGIGMLASSLSISSDLRRLTSQPPSKLPPRRPQPQPRLRTRTRLFSSKMPHLTVSKFTKRLLYTIPESSTSSLYQGHQRTIGKNAGSEGVVRPFGLLPPGYVLYTYCTLSSPLTTKKRVLMAHSLSAYGFEANFNGLLTQASAETPSTDASTPVSSYPSSPASSPSTQSDEPHIPRPSNAYIIFRSEFVALHKESLSKTQQKASKLASAAWRQLPKERQDHYRAIANKKKREHALAYPGYKYKPRRSSRGKKVDGRKKTGASVAQISMDEQNFYHRSPNSIAAAPEVLQPLEPIYSSVDLSHQPFVTTVDEISPVFDANQVMHLMQSLYHPPPPSVSPFDSPGFPQLNAFSPDTTVMMNEDGGFYQFLMTPDPDPSFLDLFGVYPGGAWELASSTSDLPDLTTHESMGYPVTASPEDYPELFDLWPEEVVPFSSQLY